MDANTFCYWLQGFVELADTPNVSEAQWRSIKDHLTLVFKKVTPQVPSLGFPLPRQSPGMQPAVAPVVPYMQPDRAWPSTPPAVMC